MTSYTRSRRPLEQEPDKSPTSRGRYEARTWGSERTHVRPGDCVYNDTSTWVGVAHCVKYVTADERVLTECRRWFPIEKLSHNLGRREPCEQCAAAIERRTAQEVTA